MDYEKSAAHNHELDHDHAGYDARNLPELGLGAAAPGAPIPLVRAADNTVALPAGATLDDIVVQGSDLIIRLPDGTVYIIVDGAVNVPTLVIEGVVVAPVSLAALVTGYAPEPAAGGVPDSITLPSGVTLDDVSVRGRDLIIQLPDGTTRVVANGAIFVPELVIDGVAVPALNLSALLTGREVEPEAGPVRSSGGNFFDPAGPIQDAYDLGDLLPYTELFFSTPLVEENLIELAGNRTPTIRVTTPEQPAGVISAVTTVNEAGLPARGLEPAGSNAAAPSETTAGTITFTAPDGLLTVTIDGVAVIGPGQVFTGPNGTLTITGFDPDGTITYSYTLTDNLIGGSVADDFVIRVTEVDGDTAEATLTVNVADDNPTARPDTDAVPAGSFAPQTGNVVTGAGTTSGAAGADTPGADGASLTQIASNNVPANVDTTLQAGSFVVPGQYGVLTIEPDGDYSYQRNPGTPGGVSDVFSYTLTDGDGDTSTATLTIVIGDAPPTVTVPVFNPDPNIAVPGTEVDEAGLPARAGESPGSNAAATSETTAGTISFTAVDGPATVAINGTTITAPDQTITVPNGVLTITGFNPAAGTLGYSFTLTDNTAGDAASVSFQVTVTDVDGDVAPATLTIGVIDDVPTARPDTDAVPAGSFAVQTGNVVTGDGTTSGAAGADTRGADSAVVTRIASAAIPANADTTLEGGNFVVAGQYGVLTIAPDGSYSYARNAGSPGGVSDVFNYTLTDSDGDTSSTTLTISIGDSPVDITPPVFNPDPSIVVPGTEVSEAGLPARGVESPGSNAAADSETTAGTITFTAPDGPATIAINGIAITGTPGQTITVPNGVLTITGLNLAAGTLGYSFTLTDNTAGDATTVEFAVRITDVDGDTLARTLTIGVVDDVPTARADTDAVPVGSLAAQTGNVVTGDGTTSGLAGADTRGADSAVVTRIASVNVPANADTTLEGGSFVVAGQYGVLTIAPDGSYSYQRSPGTPGEVSDVFSYTLTDSDGDASTATLTISIADTPPTVTVPPPGVASAGTQVDEAGLPGRGGESPGSNQAATSETTAGTITFTAPDGLAAVAINGIVITGTPGQTITVPNGVLTITGFNPAAGTLGYSFTLTDNTAGDATTVEFAVAVTDGDGDVAPATLVINVVDDVPTARPDTDAVPAGSFAVQTGNVVTGDGTTSGAAGADTRGADSAVVTRIASAAVPANADTTLEGGNFVVAGQYGVLTIAPDGSYSYARNAGTPGGVSDVFNYTLTDSDGDTSSTTLTIAIGDSPVTVTVPPPFVEFPGTQVQESALPTGSIPASNAEFTSGTITLTAPDGPASVTIDGVTVTTVGQTFVGTYGTLTITSIAPGAIGYTYQLMTNSLGDATNDDFIVRVADQDGDSSTATLIIEIVDDRPTARPDVDSVREDGPLVADGNVITGTGGVDANASDGVADTRGADGASVSAVRFGATAGTIGSPLAGTYGSLTLNADGSYSYTLNNADARVQSLGPNDTLTETFGYTLTDGDGDTSATTLVITIAGANDGVTITGLNGAVPEETVNEANLADGSAPNSSALIQSGTFSAAATDGIATITVGGLTVFSAGAFVPQQIVTPVSTLTITGVTPVLDSAGNVVSAVVAYTYVLTDNTLAHTGPNGASLTQSFAVTVTDRDGSSASDSLDVAVIDDVPVARADGDAIPVVGPQIADGNVITGVGGVDPNLTDGVADTRGADGAAVTAIASVNLPANADTTVDGSSNFVVAGQYGVLTIAPGGGYSYARNAGTPGGVDDVFNYTLTDGDGDSSSATLTISISDAPPTVMVPPPGVANAGTQVSEAGLPVRGVESPGSNAAADSETTAGTITFTAPDGPATIAINGITITGMVGQTITMPNGVLTVTGLNLAAGTLGYSFTLTDNTSGDATSVNFPVTVTDADGDVASATLVINVIDDVPTARADADAVTEDGPLVADGNVITAAGGTDANASDGVADIQGADGAAVTAVSFGATAGTLGTALAGTYGSLTLNANGSYSYVLNNAAPAVQALRAGQAVTDVFTYTLTDGDGDTSNTTLTITVTGSNDAPVVGVGAATVSEEGLSLGIPDTTGTPTDTTNATVASGTIALSDVDGDALAVTLGTPAAGLTSGGLPVTWAGAGTGTLVGSAGGVEVVRVTISNAGAFTVTLSGPVDHAAAGVEDVRTFTVPVSVSDGTTSVASTLTINVEDDSPSVTASATQPVLTVDETVLATNATASFASVFTPAFGADGAAAANSVTYALAVTAGPSGLIDTASGEAVNLSLNGGVVEGRTASGNALVFTVAVAANGDVTLDQLRAVRHDNPNDPDEASEPAVLSADSLIRLIATVTDRDGDTASATADIGSNLAFRDDGPSVAVVTATPDQLVVDESAVGADTGPNNVAPVGVRSATAVFADNFAAVAYGADGAGTTVYSLALTGTNVASGLFALAAGTGPAQGAAIVLNQTSATTVTGSVGGTTYFTIAIDAASGVVTFTQLANIWHGTTTSADEAATLTLAAANLLRVVQTVTDRDGDSASAAANVGQGSFSIQDDGPSATTSGAALDTLVLDETRAVGTDTPEATAPAGLASVTANFADNFVAVPSFGTDGAGTVRYALVLSANGIGSGLFALDSTDTVADGDGIGQGAQILLTQTNATTVTGAVGGTTYFTISIDAATGTVTFAQANPIWHPTPGSSYDEAATLTTVAAANLQVQQTVTDRDGDAASAAVNVGQNVFRIQDDGPTAALNGTAALDTLVLDETRPVATDTGVGATLPNGLASVTANFADNFAAVTDFGEDGPGSVNYTLVLSTSGIGSGLFALDPTDTVADADGIGQGAQIALIQTNATTITGAIGGTTYFTISINAATGVVTFAQANAIWHPTAGASHDEAATLTTAAAASLLVRQTVTDADGDTSSTSVNVGQNVFRIQDDGPTAAISAIGTGVVHDETAGVQADTDFNGTLAVSATSPGDDPHVPGTGPIGYAKGTVALASTGADPGSDGGTVVVSLTLSGQGVDSGLDTTDGTSVLLFTEGANVVGRAGAGGPAVFAIGIEPDGTLGLVQYLSLRHPTGGAASPDEQINIAPNVLFATTTVTDVDGDTATATTSIGQLIGFQDDAPIAVPEMRTANTNTTNYKVVFILDFSGSIDDGELNTQLDAVRAAGQQLFANTGGTVSIEVVVFSNDAFSLGPFNTSDSFTTAINGLNPDEPGGDRPDNIGTRTNFSEALLETVETFNPSPNTENLAFFLSDGNPNEPGGVNVDNPLTPAAAAAWSNFVNGNQINVTSIGVGGDIENGPLQAVDVDGQGSVIQVGGFDELIGALLAATAPPAITGNVLSNGDTFGADGGQLVSITFDGMTYNAGSNLVNVATARGGRFSFNFTTGAWSYSAPIVVPAQPLEQFTYVLRDGDGDTSTATLAVNIARDVARDNTVLTNIEGSGAAIVIPDAALLYNDDQALAITGVSSAQDGSVSDTGTSVTFTDNDTDGGSFTYSVNSNPVETAAVVVDRQQAGQAALDGTGGAEVLIGRDGAADTLNGNDGDDYLIAGSGADILNGGAGNDVLLGGADGDTLNGGTGLDQLFGGAGNDTLNGDDQVDLLSGDAGVDALSGGAGDDFLDGGGDNDSLTGGTGADTMTGGTGNDTFTIGTGESRALIGGDGNDGRITGFDRITDFSTTADTLALPGTPLVPANVTFNGNDSELTIGGDDVSSHRIISGIITFSGSGTFGTTLTLTTTEHVAAVVDYLQRNDLGGAGTTVAFVAGTGATARTYIYSQVGTDPSAANDILVELTGVTLTGSDLTTLIASGRVTPVVLDLDGDGVEFVSASAGVTFDYAGDGAAEATAWAAADDGLLVLDLGGDRAITASAEFVFGGGGATDLEALAARYGDALDAGDADFGSFGVWQDVNGNGVSEAGEFRTLGELGITSVSLVSDNKGYVAAQGDVLVSGEASFVRNGASYALADASFATAPLERMAARTAEIASTTAAAGAFLAVAGTVGSVPAAAAETSAASEDSSEASAPATLQVQPATSESPSPLVETSDRTDAPAAPVSGPSNLGDEAPAPAATLATVSADDGSAPPAANDAGFEQAPSLFASGSAALGGEDALMDALLLAVQPAGDGSSAAPGGVQATQDLASVEEAFSDVAADQFVDAVVTHFAGEAGVVPSVGADGALAALFATAEAGLASLATPFDANQLIDDMSAMAAAQG